MRNNQLGPNYYLRKNIGVFLLTFSRIIIFIGRLFQPLIIILLKPDELIAFSKHIYASKKSVTYLGDYNLGEAGLQNNEKAIFDKYKIKPGHCLVLCCGGGREAIALAKQGFTVTAVDFVEQLVQQTIENSKRAGFPVKGIVGDISNLVFPANSFNLIYFASASYSYIPTRKKRIAMLKTLKGMLAPDGYIICQFFSAKKAAVKINKSINLKKLLAWLCRGNIEIEDGDAIWENAGFIHIFHFFHELLNELSESGLEIMGNPAEPFNSNYVVLKKTQQTLSSHLKT